MAENKLTEIIETSLEQIKQVVDANTIIGTPITTPNGTTIIPVSKVMVGFASGGIDYLGKNMKNVADASQKTTPLQTNFGGGGGTGVTVQPVGFLVVAPEGNVSLINVGMNSPEADRIETISNFIEKSPELISKIAAIFKKNGTKNDKDAEIDIKIKKETEKSAK
jgi:sporulation protein YtfJ